MCVVWDLIHSRRGFRRTGNWFWGSHWWRLRRSSRWRFWGSCRHRCSGRLRPPAAGGAFGGFGAAKPRPASALPLALPSAPRPGWLRCACYGCFRGASCKVASVLLLPGPSVLLPLGRLARRSLREHSARQPQEVSGLRRLPVDSALLPPVASVPLQPLGVRRLWGSRDQWGFCGNAGCDRTGAADCAASAATNSHLKLDGRCADEPAWQPQDQAVSTWPDALFSRPQCFDQKPLDSQRVAAASSNARCLLREQHWHLPSSRSGQLVCPSSAAAGWNGRL